MQARDGQCGGVDPSRLQVRGVPVTLEGMNIATTTGGFNANFAVSEKGTFV